MFCPCARSYFVVEGLQTESPRLVRSRFERSPTLNSRAPLPMQIRPQPSTGSSSGNSGQREYGQGQGCGYGPGKVPAILITPIPEEAEQGPGSQVRSRPSCSREHSSSRGILKVPTEEFPFDNHDIHRQPQSRKIQRSNDVREEVGKSPNPGPNSGRNSPASDVVKLRVYRKNRHTTQGSCNGVIAEEVKFREGDVVVRSEATTERSGGQRSTVKKASTNGWGAQASPQW